MKRNSEYIGVDEKFVPEDEKYVKDSVLGNREESKNKVKKALKIGLGAWAIWVVVAIVFFVIVVMAIFNHSKKMNEQIFDFYNNAANQIMDETQSEGNTTLQDQMQDRMNEYFNN